MLEITHSGATIYLKTSRKEAIFNDRGILFKAWPDMQGRLKKNE